MHADAHSPSSLSPSLALAYQVARLEKDWSAAVSTTAKLSKELKEKSIALERTQLSLQDKDKAFTAYMKMSDELSRQRLTQNMELKAKVETLEKEWKAAVSTSERLSKEVHNAAELGEELKVRVNSMHACLQTSYARMQNMPAVHHVRPPPSSGTLFISG
jgi:hypothetical protein